MLEFYVFTRDVFVTALDTLGLAPLVTGLLEALLRGLGPVHLEGLVDTPSSVDTRHQVLLNQGLAILYRIVMFLVNIGPSQEGVRILLLLLGSFNTLYGLLLVNLKPSDRHLKQLVLPFSIKCLLMEKVLLFELIIIFFLPGLNVLVLSFDFSLILESVLAHGVDGDLERCDPLVLDVIVRVFDIQSIYQFSQFFFLPFDVYVVGLEILVFLLTEHLV